MKFYTTPYHNNLLKDIDRLSAFYEAIYEYYIKYSDNDLNNIENKESFHKLNKLVYDIGSGTGILSYFASIYFNSIISIEKDSKIFNKAKKALKLINSPFKGINNLNNINNINLINVDALDFNSEEKADLIICEMLDTALIDEKEVPVLNHFHKFLKEDGEIIPKAIINIVEPIFIENTNHNPLNVFYDDETAETSKFSNYQVIGNYVKYSEFNLSEYIDPVFETIINFKIDYNIHNHNYKDNHNINNNNNYNNFNNFKNTENINHKKNKIAKIYNNDFEKIKANRENIKFNGIKITTLTLLNENIICGPTPMLNPPLIIPLKNSKHINNNDSINLKLQYIMGEGIETIIAKIIE